MSEYDEYFKIAGGIIGIINIVVAAAVVLLFIGWLAGVSFLQ
jgi:hypothetical protein